LFLELILLKRNKNMENKTKVILGGTLLAIAGLVYWNTAKAYEDKKAADKSISDKALKDKEAADKALPEEKDLMQALIRTVEGSIRANRKINGKIFMRDNLREINGVQYIDAFIQLKDLSCLDSLISMGVKINGKPSTLTTALIPIISLEKVAEITCVINISMGQKASLK